MTARRRHNHTNTHTHTYKASTSVFGDRRYSHMPIVCVASTDNYDSHSNTELYFLVDGQFIWLWASGWAKFPKMEIACPGRPWTTSFQNFTLLALSSPEQSVIIQNYKQTVNDISTPCPSAGVDKKGKVKDTIR